MIKYKLRTKLTLLIEGLIFIIVLVVGIITTVREKVTLENELRKRGIALAEDLAQFSARPLLNNDLATLRRFVNHSMNQDYVRYVIILDNHGNVVMHSDLSQVGKIYQDRLSKTALSSPLSGWAHGDLMEKGEHYYDIFAPIMVSEARLGTVRLGYSHTAVEKEITTARHQILFIGLVTIVFGGVLAYLLASYISLPITRISAAMGQVANGALDAPPKINRNDEVGVLADSFNKMAKDLARHRRNLEVLVEERTEKLESTNVQLTQEIFERRRAEQELQESRQHLRDLASHLQSIREEERSHIAREIHDELGQALTALKMDTHWLASRLPSDQTVLIDKLSSMSRLINHTVEMVRRIAAELRPGLLDDFGLTAAIEWHGQEFASRAGIECEIFSEPEDIILDQERSIALFRIFQETLTNVARHADATRVEVFLKENPDAMVLEVRDNGNGISAEQISSTKSFGLMGMRERVHALGGDLKISGIPDEGTLVRVSIPLDAKERQDDQDTHCG